MKGPLFHLAIRAHLLKILGRIRLGTFNVNGDLPTQDLGAWVRGSDSGADKFLPPLKVSSEITLGESIKTKGGEHGIVRRYVALPTLTHLHGIDEISEDPDVLVLGFQELDLSAGALLYSTETFRENAWTSAVFAGLGEKVELYDKVSRCGHSSVQPNENATRSLAFW